MNAQTAAVIDFQKPLTVRDGQRLDLVNVHFSDWVPAAKRERVSFCLSDYLNKVKKNYVSPNMGCFEYYQDQARSVLLGLLVMDAICGGEYERLCALYFDFAAFRSEQQAA